MNQPALDTFEADHREFGFINLDSWLERATHQESQARTIRTTVVLTGITSCIIAVTSKFFTLPQLLGAYVPCALFLVYVNLFYSRKGAAWGDTAVSIQNFQIDLAKRRYRVLDNILTCDEMYKKVYDKKYKLFRYDRPTKMLLALLTFGFALLAIFHFGSYEKIEKILGAYNIHLWFNGAR